MKNNKKNVIETILIFFEFKLDKIITIIRLDNVNNICFIEK